MVKLEADCFTIISPQQSDGNHYEIGWTIGDELGESVLVETFSNMSEIPCRHSRFSLFTVDCLTNSVHADSIIVRICPIFQLELSAT